MIPNVDLTTNFPQPMQFTVLNKEHDVLNFYEKEKIESQKEDVTDMRNTNRHSKDSPLLTAKKASDFNP